MNSPKVELHCKLISKLHCPIEGIDCSRYIATIGPRYSTFDCPGALTKVELHTLILEVNRGDVEATSKAVVFVSTESFGMWHNRARAKLCRHFKNHPPTEEEKKRMVDVIIDRLISGKFSEQFKDQLAMAIRFAPNRMTEAASVAFVSPKDYVRRYGAWIQNALSSLG